MSAISLINVPDPDGKIVRLKVSELRLDAGTQPREQLSGETVIEYAELMLDGVVFPPPTVFDDGSKKWLADGFHRVNGAMRARILELDCKVFQGTQRDAVLYSCGANATNGLKRSNADKRRAVLRMLNDESWGMWADTRIAEVCRVSSGLVGSLRAYSINPQAQSKFRKHIKNGVETIVNTSNLGRPPRPTMIIEPPAPAPTPERPPGQPASRSVLTKFLASLRANDVEFRQNVRTDLGMIMCVSDTAIYHVEEILTPAAFREAFALVMMLRAHHDKKLSAVIVGRMTEEAKPWAVEARKCGVQVKHLD